MGISAEWSRSLQKTLLASSSAAAWLGPKIRRPSAWKASTIPAAKGASGPTTVNPTLVVPGEADQGRKIVGLDRHVLAFDVRAGIARGDENAVRPRALRNLPGQGVFPAAVANNEDIHVPDSRRVVNQAILAQPARPREGEVGRNRHPAGTCTAFSKLVAAYTCVGWAELACPTNERLKNWWDSQARPPYAWQ